MDQLCRVCLQRSNKVSNIFAPVAGISSGNPNGSCVADVINELTGCELVPKLHEALPQYICFKCIKRATAALEFKRVVLRSHQHYIEIQKSHSEPHNVLKITQEDEMVNICNILEAHDLELIGDIKPEGNYQEQNHAMATTTKPYKSRRKTGPKKKGEHNFYNNEANPYVFPDEKSAMTKCPYCHLILSNKGNLTIHMRKHTGERPFQCPHCPKTFIQKQCMIVHVRTHTGERPFKCASCPKSFAQVAGLISHHRKYPSHKTDTEPSVGKRTFDKHEASA